MNAKKSQRLIFIISLLFLVGMVFFVIGQLNKVREAPIKKAKVSYPVMAEVNYIQVNSSRYQATIVGYGSAKPRYQLKLKSSVSGNIKTISSKFETGNLVSRGAVLITLDDTDYRAAMATAQVALASAKLLLLQEKRATKQAKIEWQASGMTGMPDSDLVLRYPQLELARQQFKQAQANLLIATRNLKDTKVVSPFDAVIVSKEAVPGGLIQPSIQIATLYSSDRVEIELPLSVNDWVFLEGIDFTKKKTEVTLTHIETGRKWQGKILRSDQYLNENTRQRTAVVGVDNPLKQKPQLLSGTFLKATIKGKTIDGLWKLPPSAINQRGKVWVINPDNKLQSFSTKILFSDDQSIYIKIPEAFKESVQNVVIQPLNSYFVGMKVNAIEVESE
jgi:RND family efflux transporter MFP subunit